MPIFFTIAIFLCVGLVLTLFPEKVQRYAIYSHNNHVKNPFIKFIEKPTYILLVRTIGIIALVAVAFLMIVYLKK